MGWLSGLAWFFAGIGGIGVTCGVFLYVFQDKLLYIPQVPIRNPDDNPYDTVKVRVQLQRSEARATGGTMTTAIRIINNEGFLALYKGLSAVMAGIVPKMAIRFSSFESYKNWLGAPDGGTKGRVFLAGLGAGVTEAVLVVTPAEVCKIRMQAQSDPVLSTLLPRSRPREAEAIVGVSKYRDVWQTAVVVAKEEGVGALYKGLAPTILRQGCNQAVNFTCYESGKRHLSASTGRDKLAPWEYMILGGLSGGIGPCVNNPLDVVKTRLQKQVIVPGKVPQYDGFASAMVLIARKEGIPALWKGLTPRLMRIMPGQAITFMTYEWVSRILSDSLAAIVPSSGKASSHRWGESAKERSRG